LVSILCNQIILSLIIHLCVEKGINERSEGIDNRHIKISEFVTRKLVSVEDVEEMDKFSNDLILEKSVMMDRIDEWRSELFLLIDMD